MWISCNTYQDVGLHTDKVYIWWAIHRRPIIGHFFFFFFFYKGWPRITEQTRIADRQCPLSTSGKSTRIPWFISFPTSARRCQSAERWAGYRHVHKITFRTPIKKQQEKTCEKTTLFVIHYRLIIFALSVFFSYSLLAQMVRCRSSSITAITAPMVLMLIIIATVRMHHPVVRILLPLVHLQRLYAATELSNYLTFSSQTPPLITQLFHSAFSLSAHKIWSHSVVPEHPFFPNIQRHTVWRYKRFLYCTLAFFSFSCILLAEKITFFLSPLRAQSFAVVVHQYAFR